ncbi:MAG: ParB protein [uncultured bacterium]|nr:MAG: ParB protein [uncultured bacterium]
MLLKSHNIPVDWIDFSSSWNLHPWELYTLSGDLASSFSRAGILHPPILLARDDGRFEIVCGFKRLLFASSVLKPQEVCCLILDKNTEHTVILDIVLTDQSLAHPLSTVEKARFLEICSRYLQPREILDTFCDRLMVDRRLSTLSVLAEILRQHPLLISEAHCGTLQEKIVRELLRIPSATDRVALVKLFNNLGMGEGKQKKFLPLIRDLAYRDKMSIAAYLENPPIEKILEHPDMNNPQKIQHLASFLQHQLNPLTTDAEIEFLREVKSLKIPENCTIDHSPSFEKDEVTLSIAFKNLSVCKEWIPALKRSLT